MSDAKPKTARSYRGTVVDDNAVVSINLKWLGQMFVLVAGLVYSYYMVIQRITDLERRMEVADNTVTEVVENYQVQEDIKFAKMEEELNWYQKELNLIPLSWRKKSKKR